MKKTPPNAKGYPSRNETKDRSPGPFRTLFESSPNALVMVDKEGVIQLVNKKGEVLFGYGREELIGQAIEVLVPERFREGHVGLRNDYLVDPVPRPLGVGRDLSARRKDGAEVPVEIALTPIEMAGGLFILATVTDITRRKRDEEDLERMADDLRRSNRDLEQFASMVSHDLQQPIVVISSYLKLLERRAGVKLDRECMEYLEIAYDSSQQMHDMVQGMLDYARLDRGKKSFQPVDLDEVLRGELVHLREEMNRIPMEFTREPLPVVWGDARQLAQVLRNLLGNAMKFRREDQVLKIHVGASPAAEGWQVSVQDNGIGMDPADQEAVFQIFHQLNPKDRYPGTGLGLAITRRIVERHGGRIWVDSRPGEGSTFHFTVPAPPPADREE